ncbi:ParB/RepB/Spo0J family partition protein [Tissierella praeacuta]|uniref:ParB/RepB/Spo0J family partition protein n=1 Tax=Tissierella praeacuta TaxID=43131 RepID=UPI00333FCDD3
MEDKYTVVIGHRRLAAAKLAGLEEVPCVISDMDYKTQVATMLLENMQRSDLTAYEQAQGLQMMLDLGESVSNISAKTGLSKSTVYSRVKLLELDQDKLKESVGRGATLMDYMELEKIKDIELRNEVLETVGTENFNYKLKWAIDKEKKDKKITEIINQLKEFAEETKDTVNLSYVRSYTEHGDSKIEKPEDADIEKYFYKVHSSWIGLYRESTTVNIVTKEQEESMKKEQDIKSRYAELKEITNRSYGLRKEFVKGISNTKARKNMNTIIESTLYAIIESFYSLDYEEMAEIMNIDISDKEDIEWKDIVEHIWKQPELNLLMATYYMLDSPNENYYRWDCTYLQNEDLDYVYEFLKKLGYKMSEEEKALQDGTHELFIVEEE